MQLITLYGQASKKEWKIELDNIEYFNMTVLDFLRSKGIPIASSCDGEKVCQLCKINNDLLACNILVKEIITSYNSKITISYL